MTVVAMKALIVLILTCAATSAAAQKFSVSGTLTDSAGAPLPSATVLLLSPADSALINFTTTDARGYFEWKNIPRRNLLLKVTYVGFAPLTRAIDSAESEFIDLGRLEMLSAAGRLDEVVIVAERPPVIVKKDTIEFNAASFKTLENAVVEDLLRRLPGVEVDTDGTIRAQGQTVQRVMVDGKTFFGSDPKVASRNLPADAVSKVQVFDKKSAQAVFSGIDDGQREKTINLELREEKRKGAFGTLSAGGGGDGRYAARASVNSFRKARQLSILAMSNNVNEQGFGMEEYMNFSGGSREMLSGRGAVRFQVNSDNENGVPLNFGGRNSGQMTSHAGGVNFNRDVSSRTEINTSYFYNALDHLVRSEVDRISYVDGGDLRYAASALSDSHSETHRFNGVVDHRIDSLNSLRFSAAVSANATSMAESSASRLANGEGVLLNTGERTTASNGNSITANSSLLWRRRFEKKGRTFSAMANTSYRDSDRKADQRSITGDGDPAGQHSDQRTQARVFAANVSYTEPVGKRKYLEANYTLRQSESDVVRHLYDIGADGPWLNAGLSADYSSRYQVHRGGLNFKINRSAYSVTAGVALQKTYLDGEVGTREQQIRTSFRNALPVVRANYEFSSTRHLRFDYETSVEEPTVEQLQPVVDNSDPLNLYAGNPDLRPAYLQRVRINYSAFSPADFVNVFAFAEASYTTNAITIAQRISSDGVRTSTPVNVPRNARVSANVSAGFPLEVTRSRFNVSLNGREERGVAVINDALSDIVQRALGGRVRYDYRYKEVFNAGAAFSLTEEFAGYEVGGGRDQRFSTAVLSSEMALSIGRKYSLASNADVEIYRNRTTDFVQRIPMLNFSLSRFVLKANSGEVKFAVVNALDRSAAVSQVADLNYFERQRTNMLGRYFLLSFTYALNKQLNPLGMRPAGRMVRIQR